MFRLKGGTLGKHTKNTLTDVMNTATPLLDPQSWLAV